MTHDDGQGVWNLEEADVVLLDLENIENANVYLPTEELRLLIFPLCQEWNCRLKFLT